MPLNTPKTFCMKIENIVKEKKITHMDAVLWYCQKEGLELEGINSLISKALKEKIEADKAIAGAKLGVELAKQDKELTEKQKLEGVKLGLDIARSTDDMPPGQ